MLQSTSDIITPYVPACMAACDTWLSSGCYMGYFGLDEQKCYTSCIRSTRLADSQGWGWNYVDCLEEVAWENHYDDQLCLKMQNFCRNVLVTDEAFGNKVAPSNFVALVAGLFATALIVFNFKQYNRNRQDTEREVQFSALGVAEVA